MFILTNPDYHIKEEEKEKYFQLIDLRKNKMPIKYILGTTEFMRLDFNIKKRCINTKTRYRNISRNGFRRNKE